MTLQNKRCLSAALRIEGAGGEKLTGGRERKNWSWEKGRRGTEKDRQIGWWNQNEGVENRGDKTAMWREQ